MEHITRQKHGESGASVHETNPTIELGRIVEATVITQAGDRERKVGRITEKRPTSKHCTWYAVSGWEKEVPNDRVAVLWNEEKERFFMDYNRFAHAEDGDAWLQQAQQQEAEAGITAADWDIFHELKTRDVEF